MKRIKLITAIFVLIHLMYATPVSAQSRKSKINKDNTPSFIKKSFTASIGVGFGVDHEKNFKNGSAFGTKSALEYGLFNAGPGVISVGAQTGTSFSNTSSNPTKNDFSSRTIVVAARSAWHHNWDISRLDTYAGFSAGVGFNNERYKTGSKYNYDKVIPVFGIFAGAAYYFTPSFAVNIETGYDITLLQAGILFKLR